MTATAIMTSKGIKVEFVVNDDNHVVIDYASKDVCRLRGILYDSKRPKISVEDMNKAISKMGME